MRRFSFMMFLLPVLAVAMLSGCDRDCDCACDCPVQTAPPKVDVPPKPETKPVAPAAVVPQEREKIVSTEFEKLRADMQELREQMAKLRNDETSNLIDGSNLKSKLNAKGLVSIWYYQVEKEKKADQFEDSVDKVVAPLEKTAPKK